MSSQTFDLISKALEGCKTEEEARAVAKKYKVAMASMDADPALRVRAIHLRNLYRYVLWRIGRGG